MKFTAHSIRFAYTHKEVGITPVTIGAITTTGHPLGTETSGDDGGGKFDRARSIMSQIPEMTYTTKNVQEVLRLATLRGICFDSDGGNPGIEFFAVATDDCFHEPAATDNLKYTFSKGLLVPTRLRVDRRGDAELDFQIHPISKNGAAPFTAVYSGVTLPTALLSNKYAMHKLCLAWW